MYIHRQSAYLLGRQRHVSTTVIQTLTSGVEKVHLQVAFQIGGKPNCSDYKKKESILCQVNCKVTEAYNSCGLYVV